MTPELFSRREALELLGAGIGVLGIGSATTALAQSDGDEEGESGRGDEAAEDESGEVATVTFDA